MTARRRSSWIFAVAVGAIVLALPVAYFTWLDRPVSPVTAPPVAPAAAVAPKKVELSLGDVSGDVQIRRPGGEWAKAKSGEVLGQDAAVRTGEGSYAVLVGGTAYDVKLEPDTQVSIEEITDSISRLMLGGGMATARVSGAAKHVFEVRAAGSDALARTGAGAFSVSSNGKGTVAVGTREGEVEFLGAGKVVIVRAGQQSVVQPGTGPSDPVSIPSSLLLKVKWPATATVTTRKLIVAGEADPGSVVRVGGRPTPVDERGRFSTTVELAEGRNALTVQAVGVGGGAATDRKEIARDTRGPPAKLDPNLWGETR